MKLSRKPHLVRRILPGGVEKTTHYTSEREARKYFAYTLYDNMYVKTKNDASKCATEIKIDEPYTVSNVTFTITQE